MSAYLVSDKHIQAILQATTPQYPGDGFSYYWNGERHYGTNNLAQILVNENYRSVNSRYSESDKPHKFQPQNIRPYTPVEILSLLAGYEYQACETNDWKDSQASAIIEALRSNAIRRLPGYENAPWTVD